MTSLYEGPVGTAFASLGELSSHLKSFKLSSAFSRSRRAYGGTTDYASAWGYSGRKTIDFTAEVKISATTKTDVLDVYELAGSTMMERRWRILARGSRLTTQNEVQTVSTDATGGTFTLAFEGQTTTAIAFDATTGAVQTALRALSTMGLVTVTGVAGAWIVTFTGVQASQPQLLMTTNGALLTGGTGNLGVVRTTPGGQLKTLRHDMRVRFNTVNVTNLDGERVYAIAGIAVKDSALGSDAFTSVLNGVATIPSA
jgi:hypothetical protein